MANQFQLRRGTKIENDLFTGATGEPTYETDTGGLRIHDGVTEGGRKLPFSELTQSEADAKIVTKLTSIYDPEFANLQEGQTAYLKEYHPNSGVGGGHGERKLARHNGGEAISLTRERPDWDIPSEVEAWFADSGADELCFVHTTKKIDTTHFGSKLDGVNDDTISNQAYVDYVLASNGNRIVIPFGKLKTKSIRMSNTAENYRIIYVSGGGEILYDGDSFLVDKSGVDNLQNVKWTNITFANTPTATGAIFNADNVRRQFFSACYGASLDVPLIYADEYVQTYYFSNGCNFFGGSGWIVDVNNLYDVTFTETAVEGVNNFLRTRSTSDDPAANGLVIKGGNIQGLTGKAIELGACFGCSIEDVYFEANTGGDIDVSISTKAHKGLTIKSNGFNPNSAQLADPDYYPIVWGIAGSNAITSGGNTSTGNLHDLTGVSSMLAMEGDFALGKLYSGYEVEGTVGRSPIGYASYSTGLKQITAYNDRYLAIDPGNRGFEFGGSGQSVDVDGVLTPVIEMSGTANPYTSPGIYGNKKWALSSRVWNRDPEELGVASSKYVILGWICTTSGSGGSGGSDTWLELRCLTGN